MRSYRTGDDLVDAAIDDVVATLSRPDDGHLLAEMFTSAYRMGSEGLDRGELKLVNSALKEIRYAFGLFEPYAGVPKVSIFGSARTQPHEAAYECARDLGAAMVENNWMVMTGAGPGIMQAGIEGAGAENSFGINIVLPFEAEAAPVIAGDPKLINFRYFFTRKLTFMKESHAFALLPGGFGTMDESFELLTLMQTGKQPLAPVVLLDPPGGTYWDTWRDFVERELLDNGLISAADLALVTLTDSVERAVDEICGFYRRYHSMRYVGKRLILRLSTDIDDSDLRELNNEFGDIVVGGGIERTETTEAEIEDLDYVDLPRLAMHFNRANFSRLRVLIDRLNQL
ncbi:MAG: TIGR00730 family Rossman fold protein [Acidimicrobiales bacterium]